MKKAISIWSFAGKPVKESMILAKEAGFDGIELSLDESGPTGLEATDKDWENIKKTADEIGIALPSLATGLYWSYPFTSDDAAVREKGISIAKRQLEAAKILKADSILIVPGAVDVPFIPDFAAVQYDVAYERALSAFMQLKAKAEDLQIHIGVENVWNHFLLSPLEMCDFVDKIGSPYVGVYFDVGNVVATGLPEHWIRILGKRICKVHFKDYKRSGGGLSGFVDLLAGDVNWPEIMKAFAEVGYDDWATAEMIPAYTHYPEQIIWNTCAAMSRIFKS